VKSERKVNLEIFRVDSQDSKRIPQSCLDPIGKEMREKKGKRKKKKKEKEEEKETKTLNL
jgi:hypothetical protein